MPKLNHLKFKSKLLFLVFVILFGFSALGSIGYYNISSMKKNLDSLYFGSLIPINELSSITQIYQGTLYTTVIKAHNHLISHTTAMEQIDKSLKQINSLWKRYQSHFKRYEEIDYNNYTAMEIQKSNLYFKKFQKLCQSQHCDLSKISLSILTQNIEHISRVIEKLSHYEIQRAAYERQMLLITYHDTLLHLSIVFGVIIVLVLFLALKIFDSIALQQRFLEQTTKELKLSNLKLEQSSYTDSLTQLYNRRYFNILYNRELKRSKRTKTAFSFMMIDIDYFKQYNDFYGHLEGDKALQKVALALKSSLLRPSDFVFRLGGEEFGVIIVDTDVENSRLMAERLLRSIQELQIPHEKSQVHPYLSISLGAVCIIPEFTLEEDRLIKAADDNLYKAKESGRNRYILSDRL